MLNLQVLAKLETPLQIEAFQNMLAFDGVISKTSTTASIYEVFRAFYMRQYATLSFFALSVFISILQRFGTNTRRRPG